MIFSFKSAHHGGHAPSMNGRKTGLQLYIHGHELLMPEGFLSRRKKKIKSANTPLIDSMLGLW